MDFFTGEVDVEDRALLETVIKRVDQMFRDVTKHTSTSGAVSYYVRFDPSISDSKSGLFYSKLNGQDEFIVMEPTDLSIYEKDDTEHVGWFWQPYESGEPIWMKPYHNKNNNILMISYVVPMYVEEMFIGVVGMDFDYTFLAEKVQGIEIYENGFAQFDFSCANTFIEKENGIKIPLRIARGFARFDPCQDLHFSDVFKRADTAMYENKRKTKAALNRV